MWWTIPVGTFAYVKQQSYTHFHRVISTSVPVLTIHNLLLQFCYPNYSGEASVTLTGCLHVPIVGPTGRSDPGYVRLSVRPVGQTGRTDCSRTAHICQWNQCGLLANYNTAYAAAWLVVRLTSRSDQSDVVSTRFDSRIGSWTKSNMFDSWTVCPTVGRSVYTIRSSDRPVGQTSRTDRSVRRSERVNTQWYCPDDWQRSTLWENPLPSTAVPRQAVWACSGNVENLPP